MSKGTVYPNQCTPQYTVPATVVVVLLIIMNMMKEIERMLQVPSTFIVLVIISSCRIIFTSALEKISRYIFFGLMFRPYIWLN